MAAEVPETIYRFMVISSRPLLASALVPTLASLTCVAAQTIHLSQIVVVFKTHFDIGYTDMATNVVQRYRTTMMDKALEVVEQNRDLPSQQQFIWTMSGWPMHKIL